MRRNAGSRVQFSIARVSLAAIVVVGHAVSISSADAADPPASPREPLNWGALNPQPLPPGPPDPTRKIAPAPNAGARWTAPVSPAGALHSQVQASQRPTTSP